MSKHTELWGPFLEASDIRFLKVQGNLLIKEIDRICHSAFLELLIWRAKNPQVKIAITICKEHKDFNIPRNSYLHERLSMTNKTEGFMS